MSSARDKAKETLGELFDSKQQFTIADIATKLYEFPSHTKEITDIVKMLTYQLLAPEWRRSEANFELFKIVALLYENNEGFDDDESV